MNRTTSSLSSRVTVALPDSPSRERRRTPRRDVALPARFSTDGSSFETGTVISLGCEGLFLRTDAMAPVRSIVLVELALGSDAAIVSTPARVAHLHRRSGTEVLPGLGVVLVEPPRGAVERIESFLGADPIALPLEADGRLRWPVPSPDVGDGIAVHDLEPLLEEARSAQPGLKVARLAVALRERCGAEPARFRYRGRLLAPARGATWEPSDVLPAALIAQARVLDALTSIDFLPERPDRSETPEIESARRALRDVCARIEDATIDDDARTQTELLDAFLARLDALLAAIPARPRRLMPDAPAHPAGLAALRGIGGRRVPSAPTRAARGTSAPRSLSERLLRILALGVLPALLALGTLAGPRLVATPRHAPASEPRTLHVPLATWTGFEDRSDELVRAARALSAAGLSAAVFEHRGAAVARWHDGHLRPVASPS